MIYNTLHRELRIEQHGSTNPTKNWGVNSCTLEGYAVPVPHVASIVLFLLQRSIEFASVSTIFRIDFENNDIFVDYMSHIICTIQKVFWKCSFGDLKNKYLSIKIKNCP